MSDTIITESTSAAIINAPIDFVDIADWVFTLPDKEYQRCSPTHIAAGFTTSDEGKRMSSERRPRVLGESESQWNTVRVSQAGSEHCFGSSQRSRDTTLRQQHREESSQANGKEELKVGRSGMTWAPSWFRALDLIAMCSMRA
ncbi:hypothetical protein RBB79_00220 [Tunturiibacter empetritectus]|uniref:Uncharacterized protein n=2 Tax=Tunturiibacter TaxID=3154218 RepID=A0A852VLS8_9BACT|nr:hypothetical protein [Edaphobacter lichenicola]NYF92249.1 hypothetical protein [Edaphobacter lichenicola]